MSRYSMLAPRIFSGCLSLSLALLILLSACSTSRRIADPVPVPSSSPTFASMYFFTVSDYHYRNGDLVGAEQLIREALTRDPQSHSIMKRLLLINAERFHWDLIDSTRIIGLIDSLQAKTVFDAEMLIMAIDVLGKIPDLERQGKYIDLYIESYPVTDAYIRKLIHVFNRLGTVDLKLMEQIRQLAGYDTDILMYLARIYIAADPPKASEVLWQIHDTARLDEAEKLLRELTVDLGSTTEMIKLFRSYQPDEDRPYLLELVNYLATQEKYEVLLKLESDLLTLKEPDFLYLLALAAFESDQDKVLARVIKAIEAQTLPPEDFAYSYALAAVNALTSNDYGNFRKYISYLPSLSQLDLACIFHLNHALRRSNLPFKQLTPSQKADLASVFDLLPASALPLTTRNYLSAMLYIFLFEQEPPDKDISQIRFDCAQNLWNRGYRNHDLIRVMQAYYWQQGDHDSLIPLLREAITLYPYETYYLNDLGYTLLISGGDLDEAGELISKAIYVDPDDPHILDSMAWYHYLKGDYATALEWMAIPQTMEDMPGTIAYHLGMIHLALGNGEQCRYFFKRALETHDDDESARQALEMLNRLNR